MRLLLLIALLLLAAITVAQTQKASGVADFISIDTPVLVLELSLDVMGFCEGKVIFQSAPTRFDAAVRETQVSLERQPIPRVR